jgi:O-methyltransferase
MKDVVKKLVSNPGRYLPVARKAALQQLCRLFKDTSFFMQGQMDIHPRSRWHTDFARKTGGFFVNGDPVERRIFDLDPHDNTRRDMLVLLLRTVLEKGIPGALAEVGVYKGLTAKLFHHYLPDRSLYLFDTFEGFTKRSAIAEQSNTGFDIDSDYFSDTSLEAVKKYVQPVNERVSFYKGYFPGTIPAGMEAEVFAFVHLDADLYEPIAAGLEFFYPRLSRHGMLVIHDYNAWPGARSAVDTFFSDKPELPIPMPDKSGSALVVKQ